MSRQHQVLVDGSHRIRRFDRGQSTLWMVTVLAVTIVALAALIRWTAAAAAAARLDATADLVALAGVTGGSDEAADVARRNGVRLVRFDELAQRVTVVVSRDGLTATASAREAVTDR